MILLIFVSIGHFIRPGRYPGTLADIVMNFTSLSSSYNSETWFLFPYMLLSLTSPWIFRCMDKLGCVKSLSAAWVLYMASCYAISRYVVPARAYTEWYNYVLTYFDVLLSFVIGAAFQRQAEKGKSRMAFLCTHRTLTLVILGLLVAINCFISSAATSYLFEFAYIFLLLHIPFSGPLQRFLIAMGKKSMVMWMTHTFFCYHLFHHFIYGFRYPLVIYAMLTGISYAVSLPITYMADRVIRLLPIQPKQQGALPPGHGK